MTIQKKRKKGAVKLFIISLCLVSSISTLIACSNKTNKNIPSEDSRTKSEKKTEERKKLTNIAFEKNNNIYLYNEVNEQINLLGDSLKSKDLLKISPDKTKLVFREFNEGNPVYPPHVTVYDIQTGISTKIVIENINVQQIVDMEWKDNENILITGHINPSASGYAVYNIKSKIELISCVGTIRDVTINKTNILYSDTPHIYPKPKANLYINGSKIFEVENVNEEIYDGVLSKDGKALAFISYFENEKEINGAVIAYLNVAKINSDGKSISDLKKISIDSDTNGDMKFDDKNNIIIVGDEFLYKLKADILIKEKNIMSKEAEFDKEGLEKFKRILSEQFPEDFITEDTLLEEIDISSMTAF